MFKYLLSCMLLLFSSTAFSYECTKEVDQLSRDYEIKIVCKSYSYYGAHVTENTPPQSAIDSYTSILKQFITSYNKEFLKNNIQEIRLSYPLTYNGVEVGGVSNGNKILINIAPHDRDFYLKAINHEFSSNILKKLHYTNIMAWRKLSGSYNESPSYFRRCLTDGNFYRENSEENYSNGFLTNYSLTNPENDFNVYAERIFTNDSALKYYSSKYELILRKVSFVKNAYRQLGFKGKFPDET